MSDKDSSVFSIITLKDEGESDSYMVEHLSEMLSHLDAGFSFGYKIVKKCYCDNGVFYFTKDNQLKDSQICGNCKGQGYVELDSYDTKTGKYTFKGEQFND